MLRIDAKQLIENDGLYYHQGILFTGIAFFLNTPLIEKVNEYSQGSSSVRISVNGWTMTNPY